MLPWLNVKNTFFKHEIYWNVHSFMKFIKLPQHLYVVKSIQTERFDIYLLSQYKEKVIKYDANMNWWWIYIGEERTEVNLWNWKVKIYLTFSFKILKFSQFSNRIFHWSSETLSFFAFSTNVFNSTLWFHLSV